MSSQSNGKPRKHGLDYLDIISKIVLSGAVAFISWKGMDWNRDANRRNLELLQRQTNNQVESLKLQEAVSQRQIAASMTPYLACRNPSSAMALELVHIGAPAYEAAARTVMLACPHTSTEKIQLTKLKENAEQHAKQVTFLQHVNFARQYLHVGSYPDAAGEFLAAYRNLPSDYSRYIDPQKAAAAETASSNGDFQQAAQLFASAFSKVPVTETTGR